MATQKRKPKPPHLRLLVGQEREPGRLYKLKADGASVGLDVEARPYVDTSAMTATAVISTPTPDRERDIVMPKGVRLDIYRRNPIVLWEHGFEGLTFPIAKSEDLDGNLTVKVGDDGISATAHFTHRLKESEQIFALISEGIVRAASPSVSPIAASREVIDGKSYFRIEKWDLDEWSWVALPANPEAVASVEPILASRRLAGSTICEPLLKSLKQYMPEPKPQGKGADFEESRMADTRKKQMQDEEREEEKRAKQMDEEEEEPEEKMEEDLEKQGDIDEDMEEEPSEAPLGAQVLSAVQASLSDMISNCQAAMGPLENPDVKAFLDEKVEVLNGLLSETEDLFASTYPDQPSMSDGDEEEDAEMMKSWLRTSKENRLRLKGVGRQLRELMRAKGLDKKQRQNLDRIVKRLGSMVHEASKSRPPSPEEEKLGELSEGLNGLKKRLDELTP